MKTKNFTRWLMVGFISGLLAANAARAAEITSINWEQGDATILRVNLTGKTTYEVQSLEDGQRLRVRFADTTLGSTVTDVDGRGPVKGVYPYLADNGSAAYIDLLMTVPAKLSVEPANQGFRLKLATDSAAAPTAAPAAVTAPATPQSQVNAIEAIAYTKLPGDRLEVRLKMTQKPAAPVEFTVQNPARLSLDFADTRIQLPRNSVRVGQGAVSSIVAVQGERRARVVFNLVQTVHHTIAIDGNDLVVSLDSPVSKIRAAEAPKTTHFATAVKPGKHRLVKVDFRRGPAGDGKVVVTMSDPAVGINIYEQSGEIMVDFLDTNLAADLQRRLDVVDFATPVQLIDTFAQGRNVRMVIKPTGKYEQLAYQAGNEFTINVKPTIAKPVEEKKKDEFGYSGEKLSLNFQNIDVRAALQVIADFTGLNFISSDTVKGSLTLRLKDVPWDQALDIILNAKGLGMRKQGNVVMVAPADELAAKEKLALEATKQVQELEPLVSELIQINYAKADDIAALLKSIKAVSGSVPSDQGPFSNINVSKIETESNSLLSPRGQVTVDVRTNSLLIQDTSSKVREVRKLIAQLDQPVRQVMIEARLVQATDTFSSSLGAKFGTSNVYTSGTTQVTQGATIDPTTGTLAAGGLNVNLPSAGAGTSPAGSLALTIAKLGTSSLLNLELSALEAEGKGKIISSPRLITANQKKASIQQGQEQVIPLGFGKSETKKAVLGLDVTPQITPDDRVVLDVQITKDDFVDANSSRLNTKRITTQVLLDNGETVVIGGIYEQDALHTTTQVPFFGDLPLVGWLFKNKGVTDNKTELLIFLTPRILSPSLVMK